MSEPGYILTYIQLFNEVCRKKYATLFNDEPSLVFTNGLCYYYAKMLESLFPDTILYTNQNNSHVIVKNGNYFYDASGLVYDHASYHEVEPEDLMQFDINTVMKSEREEEKINYIIEEIKNQTLELLAQKLSHPKRR